MSKFHKGEIAVVSCPNPKYNGIDVEIAEIGPVYSIHGDKADYKIIIVGEKSPSKSGLWVVSEKYLRKKKPPEYNGYEKTSWSKCDWQPKEIVYG